MKISMCSSSLFGKLLNISGIVENGVFVLRDGCLRYFDGIFSKKKASEIGCLKNLKKYF
jgi:hypothetical protein